MRDDLRAWVITSNAFDADPLMSADVHAIFRPRSGIAPLTWYADQFTGVASTRHITLPFGLTAVFERDLEAYHGDALHFVMINSRDDNQAHWSAVPGVLVAVGGTGGADVLSTWAQEKLTGFNPTCRTCQHQPDSGFLAEDTSWQTPYTTAGLLLARRCVAALESQLARQELDRSAAHRGDRG